MGTMFFFIFVSLVIVQRLVEVVIANRNEKWLKSKGGIEFGEKQYKYIVLLHILFFISLVFEVTKFQKNLSSFWVFFILLFILAQALRIWSLLSLGRFWNTKIIILPNVKVIATGPYKFIRHPNYLAVVIELLVIPLIFNATSTAIVFSFINLVVLITMRIPAEEKALLNLTNYNEVFNHRARFVPSKQES